MTEAFRTPYAGHDVLAKWESPSWNEQTRIVVARRLREVPERRFLTSDEWALLEAVVARLLPQPDRPDHPIPIVPWIDRRLDRERGEGQRFADMPPPRETWRLGLAGIEDEARVRYGRRFASLDAGEQDEVLRSIQRGGVAGRVWERLPPGRFFTNVLLEGVVAIYYSQPAAWSEIGFGGPASPRGYVRLGLDQRDPWEAEERT